ncbi:hypothetical protein EIN_411230 [Entamoeba invadens IP1]|uniref:Thioredoxin domain-containing protein n=1 Tax=Entamoeba invadens IP1 TaxID=370355 RepID=A0A0A1U183_ENTIV|nr:hypothetical protein EIN_411230 [Entamoeba invadens IP1]ELP87770.1 hypothetical protein EIN_411230 [Entamoeba invadens IP1]|eukprot:XP_004254541.1 hypothetical protein EIN_411230 [Entamoeba invadens IP1]
MFLFLFLIACHGAVTQVRPEEISSFVNSTKFTFLCFSGEKELRELEKRMEKMSKNFQEVTFGIIKADLERDIEKGYSITSTPSFILQRPGYQKRFYYDEWNAGTIYEFLREGTTPVTVKIEAKQVEDLLRAEPAEKQEKGKGKKKEKNPKPKSFFILVTNSTQQDVVDRYTAIADELKLSTEDVFYTSEGEFKLYHSNDEGLVEWKGQDMAWWMNVVVFPLFDRLDDDMADLLDYPHNLPVFWFFSDKKHMKKEEKTVFVNLAQKYRMRMLFLYVRKDDVQLSLYGQNKTKTATILHQNGRTMYPLKSGENITSIEEDIEKFFKNELTPLVRSSNKNETISGVTATKLTRNEWTETLKNNSKLVLFIVDSTKFIRSILQREGAAFVNRTVNVTAFKSFWIDTEEDDIPVEINFTTLPSVLLFENGEVVLTHEGRYTQNELVDEVKTKWEFEPLPEIPEDQLPKILEEAEDIEDFEEDNEEEQNESDNEEKVVLTYEEVKELLKDKFVMETLNEINWKKLFKLGKDFNPNDEKSIKKLMKDETFMGLIGPFYKEVKDIKEGKNVKKHSRQKDEL